jgi:hypothetical protein
MAKSEIDEVTAKVLAKGGVLVKFYFDMHSKEESGLQPVMADLINNRLMKTAGMVYCYGSIDEPIKSEDMFSTTAIVTALVDTLENLVQIVFTFAPAAVEVVKPTGDYVVKQSQLQSLLVSMASISMNYSQYILSNTLSKEDLEKVKGDIKSREELGRKIMDKLKGEHPK